MRFVIFTHSLVSDWNQRDWNHGNTHFLRGVASELVRRGHSARILESAAGWRRRNLIDGHRMESNAELERAHPLINNSLYDEETLQLDETLRDADVVIVHESNSRDLVLRMGEHHREHGSYRLYFHDAHHFHNAHPPSATDPASMSAYDLRHYDGILAGGEVIRELYRKNGWSGQAWTWHEAADTAVFRPLDRNSKDGQVVWVGNWGGEERKQEIREFLIDPVMRLGVKACVYGVGYPARALVELAAAGIEYGGWLANYRVPEVFARYQVTVHIPHRYYVEALPGIPTIRPFEALACGIPLISAPWNDTEQLFRANRDFLIARDGPDMAARIETLLTKPFRRREQAADGLETIVSRHTCAHRADELLEIAGANTENAMKGSV
jgi:spore maturation protein CgeB